MWIIIGLSVIIISLTRWLLTSPYEYWKKRGVPNPKPTIFVGNMGPSVTFKKNPGIIYKEIYDEYKDFLYVGYYKFRRPGIIVRDMELVKDVLVKEFSSFHDNDLEVDENIDPLFGKNPFCLRGEKWKTIRTLITSSITHAKVRSMFNLINHVGENMVKYLNTETEMTGVNIKDLAEKFTTDAVASCAFGLDGKSFEDKNAEFKKMGEKFSAPNFLNSIKHLMTFVFPPLAAMFHIKFMPTELEKYFTNILKETIKYREENKIQRNDYLDLILSLKQKPTKYGFNDLDVMAQAMTFYIDGFETSSIAISFALYELACNPDVQNKLREEIKAVLEKHNGELTYDIMLEMTYLEQVVSESLRMHSPLFFMSRICTKSFELPPPRGEGTGPNVKVEIGTPMVIPVMGIHFDPNIYPNPDKFDPDRFTEENKNSRPKHSFLSFGEGPRICLGFKFGLAQTKVTLIHILSNFNISVNKKTLQPLEWDANYFLASAKGGLWMNLEKRS